VHRSATATALSPRLCNDKAKIAFAPHFTPPLQLPPCPSHRRTARLYPGQPPPLKLARKHQLLILELCRHHQVKLSAIVQGGAPSPPRFHRGGELTIDSPFPSPYIKDVQKLMRCLAMLSRFISRLAERALPFFKLLRKSGRFVSTQEADEAFQELK
jgi:hypothetical protein